MISEEGFLSAEISNWAKVHRKRQRGWHQLSRRLNRIAYRLGDHIEPLPTDERRLFVAKLLYFQAHEHMQAAIVLADHGLSPAGDAILRTAFESLFCLGACNDDNIVVALGSADRHYKKKQAGALLRLHPQNRLDEARAANIEKFLTDNPGDSSDLNIWNLAKAANLEDVYECYYRSLSHDASHPSASSLKRHTVSTDAEFISFRRGPNVPDVAEVIARACVVGFFLVKLGLKYFPCPVTDKALELIWPEYQALLRETFRESELA